MIEYPGHNEKTRGNPELGGHGAEWRYSRPYSERRTRTTISYHIAVHASDTEPPRPDPFLAPQRTGRPFAPGAPARIGQIILVSPMWFRNQPSSLYLRLVAYEWPHENTKAQGIDPLRPRSTIYPDREIYYFSSLKKPASHSSAAQEFITQRTSTGSSRHIPASISEASPIRPSCCRKAIHIALPRPSHHQLRRLDGSRSSTHPLGETLTITAATGRSIATTPPIFSSAPTRSF
jgi:hypothetical protein